VTSTSRVPRYLAARLLPAAVFLAICILAVFLIPSTGAQAENNEPAGPPIEGPSLYLAGIEGYSGPDADDDASVLVDPPLENEPDVPDADLVPSVFDEAPSAVIADPLDGDDVTAGEELEPTVYALDDFAVKKVELFVDGESVGSITEAPYVFSWTPSGADGTSTTLTAEVTDSSGNTTLAEPVTLTVLNESGPSDPEGPDIVTLTSSVNRGSLSIRRGAVKAVKLTVTNAGGTDTGPVAVCMTGPVAKVNVNVNPNHGCRTIDLVPAGGAVKVSFKVKVKSKAKGSGFQVKFASEAPGLSGKSVAKTKVKIKK